MIKLLIGYILGSMSGVALMCMLQINRVNKWKEARKADVKNTKKRYAARSGEV